MLFGSHNVLHSWNWFSCCFPQSYLFFPLLRKMPKTKSIKDNSLGTFSLLYRRVFFWVAARVLTADPLVSIGNLFALVQARARASKDLPTKTSYSQSAQQIAI
jgi:hypothetical protein